MLVLPIDMMCALQADLVAGRTTTDRFELLCRPIGDNGEGGDQITLRFNCPSALTSTGRICLEATGTPARGFESERSALINMVEKLRAEYGIINADYSYVVIANKRVLYEAMRNATADLSNAYYKMDHAIDEYCFAVQKCASSLSSWLTKMEQGTNIANMASVESIQSWTATNEESLQAGKNSTSRLVAMVMEREVGPASMARMFATSPMPMVCTLLVVASCSLFFRMVDILYNTLHF